MLTNQNIASLLEHDCQAVLGNHEIWHLEEHATDNGQGARDKGQGAKTNANLDS
jgi:hypothetical protein